MTKTKLKQWLKENNMTEQEMQEIWDKLVELEHKTIKMLNNSEYTWRNLESYQLDQLPGQVEKTIARREEERIAKEEQEKEEKRKADYTRYYEEHFEEIMVEKIEKEEPLTERELSRILDYELEEYRTYGDARRWSQFVYSIIELNGRYFSLCWNKGLTEQQEDTYSEQPKEVYMSSNFVVKAETVFTETKPTNNDDMFVGNTKNLTKKKEEKLEESIVEKLHEEIKCTKGACTIAFNKAKEICEEKDYRSIYKLARVILDTTLDIMDYER